MISLTDYHFNETPLIDSVLRLSKHLKPQFPLESVKTQLALLAEEARLSTCGNLAQDLQLKRLIKLFYHQWSFGHPFIHSEYRFSDTFWIDYVLKTRRGCPFSLGVMFLYLAQAVNLPLVPVCFPTQLILRADWLDGDSWLIDPMNGNTLDERTLEGWLKEHLGEGELLEEDLAEADNEELIHKFLLTLKSAYMQEDEYEKALEVNELTLAFDPEDPYEIRDRGLLYVQLGCNHIALPDLVYFINQCPDDPVAKVLRGGLSELENSLVLH